MALRARADARPSSTRAPLPLCRQHVATMDLYTTSTVAATAFQDRGRHGCGRPAQGMEAPRLKLRRQTTGRTFCGPTFDPAAVAPERRRLRKTTQLSHHNAMRHRVLPAGGGGRERRTTGASSPAGPRALPDAGGSHPPRDPGWDSAKVCRRCAASLRHPSALPRGRAAKRLAGWRSDCGR